MPLYPKTALLLIDIQSGLDDEAYFGPRSNPSFENNVSELLKRFRNSAQHPVILHVQHLSKTPGSPLQPHMPGVAIQPYVQPLEQEQLFTKSVHSAFIGTKLEETIRSHQIQRLFIAGITVGHCVSTSIRMAADLGVCAGPWGDGEIFMVQDACSAHAQGGFDAETIHAVNVATLDKEFCTAITTLAACELISQE